MYIISLIIIISKFKLDLLNVNNQDIEYFLIKIKLFVSKILMNKLNNILLIFQFIFN